jgi:thioesterase domain-containing protein/acyl carrier protein
LAAIWKDVLDLDSIDTASSFFDLGGTSVLLVRLFSRINKAFNTSMPITTIFDAQTISSLAMVLGAGAPMSHLVQVQTGGSKPPLFMVHSYLLYQGLSKSLGTDQPFYGLRELKEEGQLNLEERTARYVAEIRKVQPQGPYNIAGWCAAGPLTIELARQLLQAGEEVSYLALFDSWLPGYLEMLASTQDSDSWLPWGAGNKFSYHRNRIRGMALSKKASYGWTLISRLVRETRDQVYLRNWQRLQTLAEKFNFPLPQFMHNTTLQTFSALRNYQGKRLPVRVTLIRASEAREVKGATVSCGWEQIAEKGVDVVWAPGDHETMFLGENLKVTSDIVRRGMETTVSGGHAYSATINGLPSPSMLPVIHVDCPTT